MAPCLPDPQPPEALASRLGLISPTAPPPLWQKRQSKFTDFRYKDKLLAFRTRRFGRLCSFAALSLATEVLIRPHFSDPARLSLQAVRVTLSGLSGRPARVTPSEMLDSQEFRVLSLWTW